MNWIDILKPDWRGYQCWKVQDQWFAFAGDLVLLASSDWDLQHALDRFSAECDQAVIRISTIKTEALCLCRSPRQWTLQVSDNALLLRSESPSGKRAKLRTVAASNNRNHTQRSLYYCLFALRIYSCFSSRTFRSWWTAHSNATPAEWLQHYSRWRTRWYSRVTKDRTRGFKHWLVKQTQLCVTLITLWSHSRSLGTPQNSTSLFRSSLIFKKLRKWPTEWYFKYSTSGRDLIILQFAPVLQAVKPMDLDAYSHQIGVKNCSNDYDTSIFIEVTKGPCPPDF